MLQIPEGTEMSLIHWYLKVVTDSKDKLKEISNWVVADVYFSNKTFADNLIAEGFNLIGCFRSNAKLRYLYAGVPIRSGILKSMMGTSI